MDPPPPEPTSNLFAAPRAGRVIWAYGALLVLGAAAALFLGGLQQGGASSTPTVVAASGGHSAGDVPLQALLLALATITLTARVMGAAFERFLQQPAVMGEIAAGLVLGPSVLGAALPEVQAFLLPPVAAPYLGAVAKLGVVLFMFLVGLEFDPHSLKGNARSAVVVSNAGILVPFIGGAALAWPLFGSYAGPHCNFPIFMLFLGVSLSVTAFPVLARILIDRNLHRTALGLTALAVAAVGDATAWCLLAFVSGVARIQASNAVTTVALVLAFAAAVVLIVRPLVRKLAEREARRDGELESTVLAVVFGALLLCAAVTEAIGIHALFGAFAFGVVLPHEGRLAAQLKARMADLVSVLLLPVFFAFTGLRTQIGLLSSGADWALCGAIVLVATLGKIGGVACTARFLGLPWRPAGMLGVLMNTRGLMELIVLNVGLDMGILSPTLFAMLVLMALITTFGTAPLLALFGPVDGTPPTPPQRESR